MALTRDKKSKILQEVKDGLEKQKVSILVDFAGLKTKEIFDLRNKLRENDSSLKVVKKTLLNMAFEEKKLKVEGDLQGEIAIVIGEGDQAAPAKTVFDFGKAHNKMPRMLGGFLGTDWQNEERITSLAQLPSREVLLANFVGVLAGPLSGLAGVLKANIREFVYVLGQIKK